MRISGTSRLLPALVIVTSIACAASAEGRWSGFSVGVDALYGQYTAHWDDRDYEYWGGTLDEQYWGYMAGLHGGYNRQFGTLIAGVTLDADFGDIQGAYAGNSFSTGAAHYSIHDSLKAVYSARARVGIVVDDTVLYLGAGPAWASTSHRFHDINPSADAATFHNQRMGSEYCIGIEHLIPRSPWSVDVEFFRLSIPDAAGGLTSSPTAYHVGEELYGLQLGVNYHF